MEELSKDYINGIGNEILYLIGGLTIFLSFIIYQFLSYIRNQSLIESDTNESNDTDQTYHILPTYNRSCPVCLNNNPAFKVATNCGHAYCGSCMLELAQHSQSRVTVNCAVCRSAVTWIIEQFTPEERSNCTPEIQTLKASLMHLKRYLSVYSRSFFDHLRDLPTLAYFMFEELTTQNGILPFWSKLKLVIILIIVLLYVLIPYDLVPEMMFGYFGLLDDFLAATVLLFYACELFRYFITIRQN